MVELNQFKLTDQQKVKNAVVSEAKLKAQQEKIDRNLEEIAKELSRTITSADEITVDDMIESTANVMRRQVYQHYPAADPKVVEGLLMLYKCYFYDLTNELQALPEEEFTDKITYLFARQAIRFSKAYSKTLEIMYS